MIANGVDINAVDGGYDKWTPIFYASRYGNKEVVELLITKGADVNARDKGWN